MVTADGKDRIISKGGDLFYAIRGGGGGFGIIYGMTIKLHRPTCDEWENCCQVNYMNISGDYKLSD